MVAWCPILQLILHQQFSTQFDHPFCSYKQYFCSCLLRPHICKQKKKKSNYFAGDEAKVIWTKLRSCHREALRRQRQRLKSGAAAETIKQWKFQKQLEFLLPYMANRKQGDNLQHCDDEESQKLGKFYNCGVSNQGGTHIQVTPCNLNLLLQGQTMMW